jgi:hypothetical protein
MVKVAPRPGPSLRAAMVPWCAVMMAWVMVRPMPEPPALRLRAEFAGVGNGQFAQVPAEFPDPSRGDGDGTSGWGVAQRVVEQVADGLGEPALVGQRGRGLRLLAAAQGDSFPRTDCA